MVVQDFFYFFSPPQCSTRGVFFLQQCRHYSYSLSSYLMVEDKWCFLWLQRPLCYCQWTVIIHWPGHHLAMKNVLLQSLADIHFSAPYHSSVICHWLFQTRLILIHQPAPLTLLKESIFHLPPLCAVNNPCKPITMKPPSNSLSPNGMIKIMHSSD